MKYLFFDFETTGLSYKKDEIIEMGLLLYEVEQGELKFLKEAGILIKHDKPLPEKIKEITHITDEMLKSNGVSQKEAYLKLKEFFDKDTLLIAYNIQFDIKFFERFIQKFEKEFTVRNDLLDVMAIYKDFYSYPHRLESAIENLKIDAVNSHRALDDVRATRLLLKELKFRVLQDHNIVLNIKNYINVIGFNPKYPTNKEDRLTYVDYVSQRGNCKDVYNFAIKKGR